MKKVKICIIALMILLGFSGCDLLQTEEPASVSDIEISITGLMPLADTSLQYVGWIVKTASASKALVIVPDAQGNFSVRQSFPGGLMQLAQSFMVSIEKKVSDTAGAKPSNIRLLSGVFNGPQTELKADNSGAILDFSTFAGKYILSTPTDAIDNNDINGIWFCDWTGTPAAPTSSLVLTPLTTGWIYNGWVEKDGKTLSIGEFKTNVKDSSNQYSEALPGYNFPGEDFLKNAPAGVTFPLDLKGAKVYITMQPVMGDRSVPFYIKVLEATVPTDAVGKTGYDFVKPSTDKLPKGNVKLYLQI